MRIISLTSEEEYDKVKDEWVSFEKKVNNTNVSSSYIFQRTWWKHFKDVNNDKFGYNKKLCILFLYNDNKELIAIAPFCEVKRKIKKIFWYKTIEFIGQQFAATYLDFISENLSNAEVDYIFKWLRKNKKFDLIQLRYIPEFTKHFDLDNKNVFVLSACPEINGRSYSEIRKEFYSKNLKHKLNRIKNKIEREEKELKFEIYNGIDILHYYKEIINISKTKALSNKHSIYNEVEKSNFVYDLLMNFSLSSKCVFLNYKDKFQGYNWGITYNNKYFALEAAYTRSDDELEIFSIGNLIYDKLIQNICENNIETICLGTGIDSYKLKFTKKLVKIHTILRRGNTLLAFISHRAFLKRNEIIQNMFFKEFEKNINN